MTRAWILNIAAVALGGALAVAITWLAVEISRIISCDGHDERVVYGLRGGAAMSSPKPSNASEDPIFAAIQACRDA